MPQSNIFSEACPEVIIPLEVDDLENDLGLQTELKIGYWVQVNAGNAIGMTGEVVNLQAADILYESGLSLPSAVIRLPNDEEITVPVQNIVILSDTGPDGK